MSETVKSSTELPQDIKDFRDAVRRKTGELEPGDHARLVESSFINRQGFSYRYEADVIANMDISYPPDVNLWHIVSPILYSKEEYTFNPQTMLYTRSGVSAEPDMLETVPPMLDEWRTRQATAFDLGRVAGVLEYLENEDSYEAERSSLPRHGSRLSGWLINLRS